MTKYCTSSSSGTVDNKTKLELSDDAAKVNWSRGWRMPTLNEENELRNNCTWEWTSQNGVNGYKVTSNINGNSIFLPMPDWVESESVLEGFMKGSYWSSSLFISSPSGAYQMCLVELEEYFVYLECMPRHCPTFIRPVCP
jgi:hypothetical protein